MPTEMPKVSPETRRQRVERRFAELGGLHLPWSGNWPNKYTESDGPYIDAAAAADRYADESMLDEIHAMLRFLCEKLADDQT